VVARIAAFLSLWTYPLGSHEGIPPPRPHLQFRCRSPRCQGNHAGLFNASRRDSVAKNNAGSGLF
jgi:hypothetical protein